MNIASFELMVFCVYRSIMESFFCILIEDLVNSNIASQNMVTKNDFQYDLWKNILTIAKNFDG
jgi:hypothetical protein